MSSVTSPASSRTASPGPHPSRARANRAALRDYYGLKTSAPADSTPEPSPQLPYEEQNSVASSEFDDESFDAEAYVRKTLATKHLDEILRIESSLISEIKSLDGEKKALVYDNYSKLITATDTIRKMRDNMGPLMPEDSALNDNIAHIAETAKSLAIKLPRAPIDLDQDHEVEEPTNEKEVSTVKWVLDAPQRLRMLLQDERREEAEEDWNEAKRLLNQWKGVSDVEDVQNECRKVMEQG